jgi:tRNA-uridine 2-sulfurtransferase
MSTAPRIVVAMSGGVDSSVAAALLLEQGYHVEGASLRLWDSTRRDDRVCSDARDAAIVARALGIPHQTIDERERFDREVVTDFVRDTAAGRTPNPCMACNSRFKLGLLLGWARARGADAVATGHYARVENDGTSPRLFRASDRARDQSYFLFELSRDQLRHTQLPLGALTKEEVRALARHYSLPTAEKPDSQDLCFGRPADLVAARGLGGRAGTVVDGTGTVLGRHAGVESFTIGQRRGLGIAASTPLYVQQTRGPRAEVVVGPTPPQAVGLEARSWNWIAARDRIRGLEPTAKLRSRHDGVRTVVEHADGGRVRLSFPDGALSVTPGQAVVLYDGDELLGGGWIERAIGSEDAA